MNNETQTIPITVILVAPAPAPAGWGLAPAPSASASPSHSILYEGGIGGSGKFKYGDTTVNPVLGGPTRQATSFNIAGFPAFAGAKSAVIIRGDALVDIGAAQSIARQQQAILLYNTGAVLDTNVIGYLKTHKDIQTIWLVGELTVSTEGKTALVTDNPTLVVNQVTGANRCETLNQAQKDIRSTEGIVYIDGDAYVDQALVLPLLAGGKTKIALVYPNNICGISPSEEFTAKTIYLVGPDPTAKANINSTNIGRYPRFLGLVAVREKYNRGNRTKTNVTQDIQMDIYRKQNGFVVVQGNNRGGTAEAINSIVYPSQQDLGTTRPVIAVSSGSVADLGPAVRLGVATNTAIIIVPPNRQPSDADGPTGQITRLVMPPPKKP